MVVFFVKAGALAKPETLLQLLLQGEPMRSLGMPEILVISALAVFLFGGKRFAEWGKGMGEAIWNFKYALRQGKEAEKDLAKEAGHVKRAVEG